METNEKSRVLDMTRGNPFRLVLKFALPLFFGNLLQQFYNLADTAIAGHVLGDHALAQIGAVSALYGLITNFAFGMNNGLALSLSRSFGAGDEQKMKHASCWMVTISMSVSIVLMSIFLLCKEPLLILLQVPEETMAGAMEYLTIILIGIPFTMAYKYGSCYAAGGWKQYDTAFVFAVQQRFEYFIGLCVYGTIGDGNRRCCVCNGFVTRSKCISGVHTYMAQLSTASF